MVRKILILLALVSVVGCGKKSNSNVDTISVALTMRNVESTYSKSNTGAFEFQSGSVNMSVTAVNHKTGEYRTAGPQYVTSSRSDINGYSRIYFEGFDSGAPKVQVDQDFYTSGVRTQFNYRANLNPVDSLNYVVTPESHQGLLNTFAREMRKTVNDLQTSFRNGYAASDVSIALGSVTGTPVKFSLSSADPNSVKMIQDSMTVGFSVSVAK